MSGEYLLVDYLSKLSGKERIAKNEVYEAEEGRATKKYYTYFTH